MDETPARFGTIASEPCPGRLSELSAHFALAERAAHIGYWRQDICEEHPHWSPGLYAMLGLDPATVQPSFKFLLKGTHPEDRVMIAQAVARAMEIGEPFYYRSRSWKLDGERVFDTHGDVERDKDGKVVALLGVVREVTAEVTAERKLKASEAAYRFMTDEATDMITRHGKEGIPTFVSPAVQQILGYSPQDLLGRSPFEFSHPDDVEMVKATVLDAKQSGETVTYMHRARHKQGHYVWLESRVRFVTNPETGEFDSAISVTRDITARKQFEDELMRAREKAESASHTKSRFLANMSHELRTPLNAILGFSDILAREMFGPLGSSRYVEYAALINESGGLLLELINDVLDMSKIEAGKYELACEEFDVGEAIAASNKFLWTRAEEKKIKIETLLVPEAITLQADRRAFKQILLNLLSNAIKFTNAGGQVSIHAACEAHTLTLSVSDNGIGIAEDILPRLAMPFEQASNDPARAHAGTGLGLALVKSLAQLHGGSFAIESRVGHGTKVTVTLPLRMKDRAHEAA